MPLFNDDRVIAATSGRQRGNMSLSYGDTSVSLVNRESFLAALAVSHKDLVCARQVHSANIACIDESCRGRGAFSHDDALSDCDGLVTAQKGLPLAIFTADCLSVFLYDPNTPAVGLAHAGWRGSCADISGKLVRLMREKFSSRPQDLKAAFGPAIGSCCYRVGEDLQDKFEVGVSRKGGEFYLDLAAVNRAQLLAEGLRDENLSGSQGCTFCGKDEFYSFRREKDACGRMMSVIMLK